MQNLLDLDEQLSYFDALRRELEFLVRPKMVHSAFYMLRFDYLVLIPQTIPGESFHDATRDMNKVILQLPLSGPAWI